MVAERDHFPRYHIGESILPSSLPILELLGARQKIEERAFQVKRGVYFQWGPDEWSVYFNELGDDTAYAWQVVRSEFDEVLLRHAAELGADVCEGVTVRDLTFTGDRPVTATWARSGAAAETGTIDFDYLIDASGRGGVLANRYLKSRRFNELFRNVAIWRYWTKAGDLPGRAGGFDGGVLRAGRVVLGHPAARRHAERGAGHRTGRVQRAAPGPRQPSGGLRRGHRAVSRGAAGTRRRRRQSRKSGSSRTIRIPPTGSPALAISWPETPPASSTRCCRPECTWPPSAGWSLRRASAVSCAVNCPRPRRSTSTSGPTAARTSGWSCSSPPSTKPTVAGITTSTMRSGCRRERSRTCGCTNPSSASWPVSRTWTRPRTRPTTWPFPSCIGDLEPGESPFRPRPELSREPTSPHTAIGGLYIRTAPELGLARASDPVSVDA